jgi:hypothetical protein
VAANSANPHYVKFRQQIKKLAALGQFRPDRFDERSPMPMPLVINTFM